MISFAPEEDERLLVDSARAFAQEVLRPRLRAHEEARGLSDEVRRHFHALGLVGMDLPQELGFAGVSLVTRALAEEELAAGDLGGCVALDPTGIAAEVIRSAPPALQKRWLAPFLDDPLRRAAFSAGDLQHVPGGARAQLLVVENAVYETGFSGVEDGDVIGIAELPPAAMQIEAPGLKLKGDGVRRALFRFAGIDAARAVGCARAAFEHARRYAGERIAFGKPVGHFQAIAFLLADMATEIDGARALTWRACRALDRGAPDAELRLAQAAAHARDMLAFVTSSAVQILGGAGYVQDHPVEKWMRDARALAVHGLDADEARAFAAHAQLAVQP